MPRKIAVKILSKIFLILFISKYDLVDGAQPANSISIAQFGATGDDLSDDTSAILSAIAHASNTSTKTVYIPPGRFHYSKVIPLAGLHMTGEGPLSSVLIGTDPNNTAIHLSGHSPSLQLLTIESLYGPLEKRTGRPYAVGVLIGVDNGGKMTDFLVRSVSVVKVSSAGIFSWHAGPGQILSSKVDSSLAGCIHITHESKNIIVAHNWVANCGDDMYAAVAYKTGGPQQRSMVPVTNILFQNNTGVNGVGRGLSAIGSRDITFLKNNIRNVSWAGVIVGSEKFYNTHAPQNILVKDNVLEDVGKRGGHSGILLSATFGPSQTVAFVNNSLTKVCNDGIRISGVVRNTTIVGNRMTDVQGFSIRVTGLNLTDTMEFLVKDNFIEGKETIPGFPSGSSLRLKS